MARHTLNYHEGDWFAVPLNKPGYALGLVARADGRGLILAYYFGPRRNSMPNARDTGVLLPNHAVWKCLVNDQSLRNGDWPIIAHTTEWNPNMWPVPVFARFDEYDKTAVEVVYSDSLSVLRETDISLRKARHLPEDVFESPRSVEACLSQLLP